MRFPFRRRVGALEREVKQLRKEVGLSAAILRSRGADPDPARPVPPELIEAARGHGQRSVHLTVAGQEVIAVLGDDEGDPRAIWDAIAATDFGDGSRPHRDIAS